LREIDCQLTFSEIVSAILVEEAHLAAKSCIETTGKSRLAKIHIHSQMKCCFEDSPLRRLHERKGTATRSNALIEILDFASAQQVIEAAHPIPAIAVAFNHQPMAIFVVGAAVILR
jgi:hypothetical protein